MYPIAYITVMNQRNATTRAKPVPSGSALKAMLIPGRNSRRVNPGLAPAATAGTSDRTKKNSAAADASDAASRRLGERRNSSTAHAPATGTRRAAATGHDAMSGIT